MATSISGNTKSKQVKTPVTKTGGVQSHTLGENIPTTTIKTEINIKPRPHGVTGKV